MHDWRDSERSQGIADSIQTEAVSQIGEVGAAIGKHEFRALISRLAWKTKIRNVEGHLAKKHQPEARRRMNEAYAQKDVDTAKRLLSETVTWLRTVNRDAAASLEEGS